MNLRSVSPTLVLALIASLTLHGAPENKPPLPGDPYAAETKAQRDTRMAWWREAKFGMFIHWGIYAVPAGTYQDKPIGGIGEWIFRNAKIPLTEYRGYAKDFTAEDYDPKAWAALAKEAGMRYMVITSKHHDGFSLFPSDASDWDVADATPNKKDLIGPLAQAARAEGLKFGLYYSQAQDWMHPGGSIYGYKEGDQWDPTHAGSFDNYLEKVAAPQVKEILTRYQPDVLWWDTPHLMTQPRAEKLAGLLSLRPGIIHNNRLGGGYSGDTETPEQFIPPTGFGDRDWETCMTMNDTWGFKSYDQNWKPLTKIITNLIDIASKGGNYLLNIGPDARGRIPQESIDLLKQVGAWMKVNGEAIYGTHASPFKRLPWGRCTTKTDGADTILYLHVWDWADTALLLPGLKNQVKSATLLVDGSTLEARATKFGPEIVLKGTAPDAISSTVKVRIIGTPTVEAIPVVADPDGAIRLTPLDAKLQGELQLGQQSGAPIIAGWTKPQNGPSWEMEVIKEGKYTIQITTACAGSGAVIRAEAGTEKWACPVPMTENIRTFLTTPMGEITLKKGQKLHLSLFPVKEGWHPVSLQSVELIPKS